MDRRHEARYAADMRFLPRAVRVALVAVAAAICGGCFQMSTVMMLKADGSGTIQQRMLFTQAALEQLRGFAALGGGKSQGFDPMSEQQARDEAKSLGTGVTYVSSTPVKNATGEGRDIVYAFTDVNQLSLSQQPPTPGGLSIQTDATKTSQQVTFKLTKLPNGNALLTIGMPRPQLPGSGGGDGSSTGMGMGQLPPEQLGMFKQMFGGARVFIGVEPVGTLVKTSSAYVTGNRVTLMDIDLDQLLTNDAALGKLQAAKTERDVKSALSGLPGIKVNTEPELTIEFKPR